MAFNGSNNREWKRPQQEKGPPCGNDFLLPNPRSQLSYLFSMSVSLGPEPAARVYIQQSRECIRRNNMTYTQYRTKSHTFKRFRRFADIIKYASTVGRHTLRYFPLKTSKHDKGLCYILINQADQIPGIESDIKAVENFYHNTSHFTVCGGQNDPNRHNCRNIGRGDLYDILSKLNKQYDRDSVITGTEYDRIVIHFFSYGDRDHLTTPDNTNWSKVAILQDIDKGIPNLKQRIPLIVFLHSHTVTNLLSAQKQPSSPSGHVITSDNLIGLFSVSQQVPGHCQRDEGSWIIQELIRELQYNHAKTHFTDILAKVNKTAENRSHPSFIGVTNKFKELYLTMPEAFYHNVESC